MNKVMCYVLSGGRDIVGKVVSETDMMVVLDTPAYIVPQQGGSFGMMPYGIHIKGRVTIWKDSIEAQGEPEEAIVNFYRQATGGIIAPTTGLIVPG